MPAHEQAGERLSRVNRDEIENIKDSADSVVPVLYEGRERDVFSSAVEPK